MFSFPSTPLVMETSMPEYYEVFGDFHGVLMDKRFTKYWEDIETFLARPDDLLIVTYPKSGNCLCF